MPLYTTVLTGGTSNFQTTAEHLNALAKDILSGQGVVGSIANTAGSAPTTGGFSLNASATPDSNIQIGAGVAYVSATPTSQAPQLLRIEQKVAGSVAIAANSSGATKFDFIYIAVNAANAANPNLAGDNVASIVTSRSSSSVTDNGTPPTFGLLLGVVTVANGFSSLANTVIADRRILTSTNSASSAGWVPTGEQWNYSANNGNKEFNLTAFGDYTSKYSPGMRLRVPRTVTPPSQSMGFTAASSQYAVKTAPAGLTFTTTFTTEAFVKINSYAAFNSQMGIVSRSDQPQAAGWKFFLNGFGQLCGQIFGTGINHVFTSVQSVPLNTWTHVAFVFNGASSFLYINGTSVPLQQVTNTGAYTITQQGNLVVGASDVPNEYFDGAISELRIWSTAQTTAQIQANMAISLVGNETGLVGLFQGNGNFNDKTTSANNLTATNGPVATLADNPYKALEYGIITKIANVAGTTTMTVFTGTDSNIPNQPLGSTAYSTERAPYGFPAARGKWTVSTIINTSMNIGIAALNTWYAGSAFSLTVPTGEWDLGYVWYFEVDGSGAAASVGRCAIGTAANPDYELVSVITNSAANTFYGTNLARDKTVSVATPTTYMPWAIVQQAGGAVTTLIGTANNNTAIGSTQARIYARCSYL